MAYCGPQGDRTVRHLLTIFTFAFVVLITASAEARQVQEKKVSGFVEEWNSITESGTTPEINVFLAGPLKGRLGWTSWSLITEGWSESTLGLTFAPTKWMEVSGSLGIETDEDPLRQGASIWLGKGRWALLSIHENGGSGYWYRYLGTFQATETISVGVNSIRFFGTGPYVSKAFGKFSLWGTYAVGDNKGIMSARLSF